MRFPCQHLKYAITAKTCQPMSDQICQLGTCTSNWNIRSVHTRNVDGKPASDLWFILFMRRMCCRRTSRGRPAQTTCHLELKLVSTLMRGNGNMVWVWVGRMCCQFARIKFNCRCQFYRGAHRTHTISLATQIHQTERKHMILFYSVFKSTTYTFVHAAFAARNRSHVH